MHFCNIVSIVESREETKSHVFKLILIKKVLRGNRKRDVIKKESNHAHQRMLITDEHTKIP